MFVYLFINNKQKFAHAQCAERGERDICTLRQQVPKLGQFMDNIHSPHSPPKSEHIFNFSIVNFK